MKKALAILLCAMLTLALVPVVALPAAAADKVVYVKDGGTGDGTTADAAVGTLADAYAALGAEGGTIVIVGELAVTTDASGTAFIAPSHTGLITIKGQDANSVMKVGKEHFLCGGPTTFDDLTIALTGATHVMRAAYNHFTFGENLVTKNYANANFPQLYVVGGDNGSARNTADVVGKDTHVTILGGKIQELIGGARGGAAAALTGEAFVEIGKNADVQKLAFGNRSAKVDNGTGKLVLDGGVVHLWAGGHDNKANGFTGDVLVVITKNFDISKSFDGAGTRTTTDSSNDINVIFNGVSGSSVFKSDKVEDSNYSVSTRKAGAKLLIASEVNAAVTATDKICTDSFTEITSGDASAYEIGAASAPAAPATIEVPARPTLTSEKVIYQGFNNGNDANDGLTKSTAKKTFGYEDGIGISSLLTEGGKVICTTKCYVGKITVDGVDQSYTFPAFNGNTVLFTAKDEDGTSYIGNNADANAGQYGHFMIEKGFSFQVPGNVILSEIALLDRTPSTAANASNWRVLEGGKLVVEDTVLFRGAANCYAAPGLIVDEGGVAFLDTLGFLTYAGKGTIIVKNTLVDQINADTFAGFEGVVADEDGNVLVGAVPAGPTPATGSATVIVAACALLASFGAIVALKKREER
ncbi:MAG: hypothetical protein IJR89_08690 [Clostridia bacterium]|nr:hypothetical protein [Clostridia bacterium]